MKENKEKALFIEWGLHNVHDNYEYIIEITIHRSNYLETMLKTKEEISRKRTSSTS